MSFQTYAIKQGVHFQNPKIECEVTLAHYFSLMITERKLHKAASSPTVSVHNLDILLSLSPKAFRGPTYFHLGCYRKMWKFLAKILWSDTILVSCSGNPFSLGEGKLYIQFSKHMWNVFYMPST